MIIFKDWTLSGPMEVIARQYDNLSRVLLVTGDLPGGYTWDMLVQVGGAMDIIHLYPMEGGVGAVLTEDQLSQSGYYQMQLRGIQGAVVRHTNVIQALIPPSLSGSGQWPTVPSEFSQMEARMREIVAHPPIPGNNGCWQLWDPDMGEYAESEFPLPGGGGGGIQSDWNQNDETAPDFIKNRPFYEKTSEVVMLSETSFEVSKSSPYVIVNASFPYTFEIGKDYTVTFDGVTNTYTAVYIDIDIGIVSTSLEEVPNGNGWVCICGADGGGLMFTTADESLIGAHTISISGSITETHKIDKKYLGTVVIKGVIDERTRDITGKKVYTSNMTYEEVRDMMLNLEPFNVCMIVGFSPNEPLYTFVSEVRYDAVHNRIVLRASNSSRGLHWTAAGIAPEEM